MEKNYWYFIVTWDAKYALFSRTTWEIIDTYKVNNKIPIAKDYEIV